MTSSTATHFIQSVSKYPRYFLDFRQMASGLRQRHLCPTEALPVPPPQQTEGHPVTSSGGHQCRTSRWTPIKLIPCSVRAIVTAPNLPPASRPPSSWGRTRGTDAATVPMHQDTHPGRSSTFPTSHPPTPPAATESQCPPSRQAAPAPTKRTRQRHRPCWGVGSWWCRSRAFWQAGPCRGRPRSLPSGCCGPGWRWGEADSGRPPPSAAGGRPPRRTPAPSPGRGSCSCGRKRRRR